MAMRMRNLCLLASLVLAVECKSEGKAAECKAENAKVAQLTAEVESLRKQLAAASSGAAAGQHCEISVMAAVSKSSSIASDAMQNLLSKTEIDEKVVAAVTGHVKAASELKAKVVDQVALHPCGSADYSKCINHITSSPIYETHIAPHMKTLTSAAAPHVKTLTTAATPAIETATKAYTGVAETVQVQVVPSLKQNANLAMDHMSSTVASSIPTLLDQLFAGFSAAAPQHTQALPKDPVDRVLLIVLTLVLANTLFFVIRCLFWVAMGLICRLLVPLGVKLPLKLTKMTLSWGFFFGTGFYVCGLCRKRKGASKKCADAKAEPKAKKQPATLKELVSMLEKSKEKGKLSDGATRLAAAAKDGKALQAPEDMKGKVVTKDVLKKALGNFKEVDMKKLGL